MRFQGRITTWNDDKGFGYITKNGGGTPLFVHIKGFRNGQRRPLGGELVTYEQAHDERGRGRAANVSFISADKPTKQSKPMKGAGVPALVLAFGFFIALLIGVWANIVPWRMLLAYVVGSAVTFFAYGLDKSAAQNRGWRTSESTLQTLALLGGWPGAAMAQVWLRHKSQKLSFRLVFWAMAAIHCAVVVWIFFSNAGRVWLANAFGG